MRDLAGLSERVLGAERRLQDIASSRDRESEALLQVWSQIRDRFDRQEREITRFRTRVDELEGRNEELARMIDDLLGSIEASLEQTGEDALVRIRNLAEEFLASENGASGLAALPVPANRGDRPDVDAPPVDGPPAAPAGESDDDTVLELDPDPFPMAAAPKPDPTDNDFAPAQGLEESASQGIRTLMSRLKGAMDAHAAAAPDGSGRPADGGTGREASRELTEIESLRSELQGLRERISAEGGGS